MPQTTPNVPCILGQFFPFFHNTIFLKILLEFQAKLQETRFCGGRPGDFAVVLRHRAIASSSSTKNDKDKRQEELKNTMSQEQRRY